MAIVNQEGNGASAGMLAGKYLTFRVQNESYGIDVLKVREIIRVATITAMPQMPSHIRGVINLRGKIIPVMDLKRWFGLEAVADTEQSCIVVVQVKSSAGSAMQMGLVVDGVEEVINLAAGDIEQPPEFGSRLAAGHILGMAKIKGSVKTLLNMTHILVAGSVGVTAAETAGT